MIKFAYDKQMDTLRISLREAEYSHSQEISDGVLVDFDVDNNAYAFDIHGISHYVLNSEDISFERINLSSIASLTLTVEDFATLHDMNPGSVRQILQDDADLPEDERRIPGAYKEGDKHRGVWRIPHESAKNYNKSNRGRPRTSEATYENHPTPTP